MALIREFEVDPSCIKRLNSTSLVLLPKKENVENIKYLSPINLLNCNYKIITKILTMRLSRHIGKLTNSSQSDFIQSRYILDNFMAAHECLHDQRIKQRQSILFKLDFKKTYDRVRWSCLFRIMQLLDFNDKWINWIRHCVSTALQDFLLT